MRSLAVMFMLIAGSAVAGEKPTEMRPCAVNMGNGTWFQEVNCESRALMRTDCPYPGVSWSLISVHPSNVFVSITNEPVTRVRGHVYLPSGFAPQRRRRPRTATTSVWIAGYFTLRATDNCGNYGFVYGSVGQQN